MKHLLFLLLIFLVGCKERNNPDPPKFKAYDVACLHFGGKDFSKIIIAEAIKTSTVKSGRAYIIVGRSASSSVVPQRLLTDCPKELLK